MTEQKNDVVLEIVLAFISTFVRHFCKALLALVSILLGIGVEALMRQSCDSGLLKAKML